MMESDKSTGAQSQELVISKLVEGMSSKKLKLPPLCIDTIRTALKTYGPVSLQSSLKEVMKALKGESSSES